MRERAFPVYCQGRHDEQGVFLYLQASRKCAYGTDWHLPKMYFADEAKVLPFCAKLFGICAGSGEDARRMAWRGAGNMAYHALPSILAWGYVRSRTKDFCR